MRIGINTLAATPLKIGGTQTYLRRLIENLARIDTKNDYLLFVSPWNKGLFKLDQRNFRQIVCAIPSRSLLARSLYEQIFIPVVAWKNKLDVFHAPASVSPFLLAHSSVVTLHDVISFFIPEMVPRVFRWYWNLTYKVTARQARAIIAVSHSARKNLIKYLGIPHEKVQVVYHGCDQCRPETTDRKSPISGDRRKTTTVPYILWVGKMFSHKNVVRLLHAYNRLIKTHKNIKHRLILCGMKSWGYPAFIKTVKDLSLEDKVIFKGYVPDDVLSSMYAATSVFVFPSLAEGFGFPILEAMSYGIPVITSNYGAMAEIAGEAALFVNPYSVEEIAWAIYRVITDESLRRSLVRRGLQRAKQFSWGRTARETLAVYEEVYRQRHKICEK